ncbi:E3 SUMO-protein ligase PIAS4 isoform X3 [Trachemys scripta elegans]|uniref:E3 SUMO-protein ligase PIAS4 isoform X3 n=1 Tax=Trachemys scripta elegans TaxID=31138 RepID=UPI001554E515|nr:E3 SUMO-protein ligase PIAS4 isoform X3 [Trachemys scripta elegans]
MQMFKRIFRARKTLSSPRVYVKLFLAMRKGLNNQSLQNNMVMSFRVSDLQMLLGFVGRSKSGLKHELVTRALQLVQFDCSPEVFKKIKELYETRYAKKSSEPGQPQQHRPPEALSIHSSYDRGSTVARTSLSTPNIDYPALYGKYLNGLGRLPPKVVKPEVRLVKLPFYTTLDELLKPTELVPQNNEKLQESPCIFALTPRQVELIRNSRELQAGVKSVQVVLRICYTDTSSPQEDQYPPNIAVKVNHSYCSVPGYYPSNKPGVEPKRPCRPINLTHLMYLSAATNRITVTWGNYGKSYSVGLYLVRQMTSAELLQRLKTIGIKHPELCKALVKEKLRLDPDSEIATTGVRVSLICPVSCCPAIQAVNISSPIHLSKPSLQDNHLFHQKHLEAVSCVLAQGTSIQFWKGKHLVIQWWDGSPVCLLLVP